LSANGFDAQVFLETTPLVPIALCPATGRVSFVGPQALRHLGYPRKAWLEHDFWARTVFPDDQSSVARARAAASSERVHTIDYRMEHVDGRVVWTSELLSRVSGPDGEPRLCGFLLDVTERKRQEVALWKNEERLRSILRRAPDAMVLTDPEGVILNMNDQAEALFDYRHAEIAGSSIDHLFPHRLRERLAHLRAAFERDPHRRSLVDGQSLVIERRDGTEVPIELSMSLVGTGKDPHQILCSVRDLTARRRVEAQLRTSERGLREMADLVPASICVVGQDHRVRFANAAFSERFGWERALVEGRRLLEVLGEALYGRLRNALEAGLDGTPRRITERVGAGAAGAAGTLPVDVRVVPQRDEGDEVAGAYLVLSDAGGELSTREAEQRHRGELAHMGRVATMGELSASIAHELSQPLTAVVTNARAARRMLGSDHPDLDGVMAALDDIASEGCRAADVLASLRDFLQRGEARQEEVDVRLLLNDAVDLLRRQATDLGVTVVVGECPASVPPLRGDPVQLKQLLLNVLANAVQAASAADARAARVDARVVVVERQIEVTIQDGGPGLPDDVEKLFQPFVTHRSGGLGMGLAIGRMIAEAHGGRLWAEPGPIGAAFHVRLPL
jgi:PAS domain S-box-containing protein